MHSAKTRVCIKCQRNLPLEKNYTELATGKGFYRKCKTCCTNAGTRDRPIVQVIERGGENMKTDKLLYVPNFEIPNIIYETTGDYFFIVSEHNGMVLDIDHASKDDRAKLIVYPYHGGDNQKFKFTSQGYIQSIHSGKVLDVEEGCHQGHKIIQYSAHGGDNQKWKYHKDGTIRLEGHDLCIDIENGSREKNAHLIAWPHHGNSNQRWKLVTKWS
jgi:hypothetical protein